MKRKEKLQGQKPSNKIVGVAVVLIVASLVFIINAHGRELKEQNDLDGAKIEQLQKEIELEKERSVRLEEQEKYMHTKQFVEEIAREKLGLIYPDEKVFKNE